MSVRVTDKKTGKTFSGKFATWEGSNLLLYSGCMSDKKGGLRGCGKRTVFAREEVTVEADNPALEIKGS